jgi:hypothetical protein
MVKLLYERETIYREEVAMLFEGKTAAEVMEILEADEKRRHAENQSAPRTFAASGLIFKEAPKPEETAGAENVSANDETDGTDGKPQ